MQDLVIRLDTESKKHLYEQIYEHIRDEIKSGRIAYKEKLPSTRSLASYLQVSRSTAELAYEQLLSEGYIESVPYKGYFVSRLEELYQFSSEFRDEEKNINKSTEKEDGERCKVDFSPNGLTMIEFPFGTWRKITKNILSQDKKELFLPGKAQGDEELRTTIARYLHASRGVNCEADQIVVGAGNDYLMLLLRYIFGEDIRIAFEEHTYPRAFRIFGLFAQKVITVPWDEGGICVEEVQNSDANMVYVMPSHQYPTGIVMPIGRRRELLNWAAQSSQRYIIEDDYDSEFRYRGKPIPSLQASDSAEKVIYIGTFSKSIAPAIRVSYMVLPRGLMKKYEENCAFFSSTVSRIDQTVLNEFIRDGYFERHLNKMRKIYREKHEYLLEQLTPFLEKFSLSGEYAGLHVLLQAKEDSSEEELVKKAADEKIRVYGLSEAYVGENKKQRHCSRATVLLGYGGLSMEEIRFGVEALKRAWL